MKILIADDNADDALLLQTWLANAGHICNRVADGEAALAYLRNERPDLIISDILMPKVDGFALCRAVKRDPAWRDIYFVFCTATYTAEPDAALALQLGAQRFLTKPVDFDRLQLALAEIEAGTADPSMPATDPDLNEPAYLQLYNERLVSKLTENYRQLQTTVAELRRQNEQLWRLTEASQLLNEAGGETAVGQRLARQTQELTQAETALFIVLEVGNGDWAMGTSLLGIADCGLGAGRRVLRDIVGEVDSEAPCLPPFSEGHLLIMQASGRSASLLQGLVLPAEDSLCAAVIMRGQTVASDADARRELVGELLLENIPGSCLLAPLRVRDKVLGLLVALHCQPDRFDTSVLQLGRLWAQQAAVAWENARLIETLRAQTEALQLSQDQVVHNARMATVGRLTAALAHEINNPLNPSWGASSSCWKKWKTNGRNGRIWNWPRPNWTGFGTSCSGWSAFTAATPAGGGRPTSTTCSARRWRWPRSNYSAITWPSSPIWPMICRSFRWLPTSSSSSSSTSSSMRPMPCPRAASCTSPAGVPTRNGWKSASPIVVPASPAEN